jgi:hypothetical protein
MTSQRKTWKEKLENPKGFPKTIDFSDRLPCCKTLRKLGAKPGDDVVLAPSLEVKEIMNAVPRGKLITLNTLCSQLAKSHKTNYCCTLTTGIFVMTVANAAAETGENTPYWRTVKNNGELNDKFPGGIEGHKRLLEQEGFQILSRGKKYFVEDFQNYLHCQTE